MKVLVVGGGGREHVLVWKLSQSSRVKKIYCAPGNGGMDAMAECVPIAANDVRKLCDFALNNQVDLTVVGPEEALTLGIVDTFMKKGLRIFGPTRMAAILEGSKVFSKRFLEKHDIPSAAFHVFKSRDAAIKGLKKTGVPIVVKADGLAAGKGVMVCHTEEEAVQAIDRIVADREFGDAGNQVVLEEFMTGEEASFLAFTDGRHVLPLPSSQDHKPVFDNDQGPNTGGMGAYSPAPVVTKKLHDQVMQKIMIPTVRAMEQEGRPYKGVLYAGLMVKDGEARVVEFNCRFGDPETQPLLMRLRTDLVDVVEAVIDEKLHKISLDIDPRPTVCVVMASGGYPGSYEKGKEISGLAQAEALENVVVFHAGTVKKGEKIVTSGGRVLGVTAIGQDLPAAISTAYQACGKISWDGAFYRKDIGKKALDRLDEARERRPVVVSDHGIRCQGSPHLLSGKRLQGAGDARHRPAVCTGVHEKADNTADSVPCDRLPVVGIVMGSDSDVKVMKKCAAFLDKMDIPWEMTIASAHRTPERATTFAATAQQRGLKLLVAGAGMAAHLAGVLAAHTDLPVIGVPLDASSLNGMDSLLSTAQMPPGVPVACMGIGAPGAVNAAVLAARILALNDPDLAGRLVAYKQEMVETVEKKAAALLHS